MMEQELTTLQKFRVLAEVECKSKTTIKSYERYIGKFINYYGEKPEQSKIIDYLYHLRTRKHYDKSSLNIVKSALKYYFAEVLEQEITIKLPTIKRRKSIPKPLHKSIIKALIQNTNNLKHRLLIELAYDAGLRPFELIKLQWSELDLNNNQGFINRGKGDKDRVIYMSSIVTQHLRDYKKIQEDKLKKKGIEPKYVFDSEWKPSYHICKRTYQQVIKNSAKKANLNLNIHAYNLRHSFGSHLKEMGLPVEDIQLRMGHNSINTTLGYAKVEKPKQIINPLDDEYFNDNKITCNIT